MGCVAILPPWRGSRKPKLMVLCRIWKERTQMNCRIMAAGSPAGRVRDSMLDFVAPSGDCVQARSSNHMCGCRRRPCLRKEAQWLGQQES